MASDGTSQAEKSTPNGHRRKRILASLALVLVLGGLSYGAYWFVYGRWHASTDDAYVHGNIITVTPRVSGTVVAIGADDTDYVRKGDLLVLLDNADAKVALASAEANLAETVRNVRELFANVRALEAEVAAQQAALTQAGRDYARDQRLFAAKDLSEQEYQHAQTTLRTDRATLAATQAKLRASQAAVAGTTPENHPLVREAKARVRNAWLALARTKILAPVSGFVADRNVQLGERVQPGQSLLAVVPLNQLWIDANFKETELSGMRIGQPVIATSDLYGSRVSYKGHVVGLGAGTGGVFALLPPQNATGNWIKVVQRLPVRVALSPSQLKKHPLRLGLSMNVTVDTHNRSGPDLATAPAKWPAYSTSVYAATFHGIDAVIARVVHENEALPIDPGYLANGR